MRRNDTINPWEEVDGELMGSGIIINDCPKGYRHDQDKVKDPKETVRWVKERLRLLDSRILSKTVRIDTGRLDIPVYISFCGEEGTRIIGTKKQMGKGATAEQAEASAVMELVERFSFFYFIKNYRPALKTYEQLMPNVLPVEKLLLSIHDSKSQLEDCYLFLKSLPLRWVLARNLSRGIDQWIPLDWFYLINEYNGPAAGNTLEEAIVQGLCEVVERHVGSIISQRQLPTPCIDPQSLREPAALELTKKFEKQGIELFLRDFSLNTGIPSVGVLAYDPKTFPHRSEIVFTVGTTPDPEKSLCRALTEVAQLAGDFENRTSYQPTYPKYTSLEEAAYLMSREEPIPIQRLPNLSDNNLRVELERCVASLKRIGLEVLAVNITHPGLLVPAVYIIVPGAHFLDHTSDTDFPQHIARTLLQNTQPKVAKMYMEKLIKLFGSRYDLIFFYAHCLELLGEIPEALRYFRKALRESQDPKEAASIHTHIASCYKELGNYEEALEELRKAESSNPDLREIYNLKGFCLYKSGRYQDAIEAFGKAIECDPGSAIDYANIGSSLRELGHKELALHFYQMALDLDPDIEFAKTNLEILKKELTKA